MITHLHLVPILRIRGAIPPLTPRCRHGVFLNSAQVKIFKVLQLGSTLWNIVWHDSGRSIAATQGAPYLHQEASPHPRTQQLSREIHYLFDEPTNHSLRISRGNSAEVTAKVIPCI